MRDNFNIVPYTTVDGVPTFKDSEIAVLWDRIWEEGVGNSVFFDGTIKDRDHFIDLMAGNNNFLYLIYYHAELVAMFWINRIEKTHCYCHFTCFKNVWGTQIAIDAGKIGIDCCLNILGFDVVLGLLPAKNRRALRYLEKVGLKVVGTIPNILWDNMEKRSIAGILVRMTREDLECEATVQR